jgi:hypothetical protein
MRRRIQPGPVHPERIESFEGRSLRLEFPLQLGLSLNDALRIRSTVPACGVRHWCSKCGALGPSSSVMPGPPTDDVPMAYISAPLSPPGETMVEIANATYGWRDGEPFVHCHGAGIEEGTHRRGGHILPHETIVATTTVVHTWAQSDIAIETDPDPETNFTLFHPVPAGAATDDDRTIVARIRPDEAIEAIARRHHAPAAIVRGSVGSLIGARFADGSEVTDHATEVLVVHEGLGALDMRWSTWQARWGGLIHGDNPVCITLVAYLNLGLPSLLTVMSGLVPAISRDVVPLRMAGTSPDMTVKVRCKFEDGGMRCAFAPYDQLLCDSAVTTSAITPFQSPHRWCRNKRALDTRDCHPDPAGASPRNIEA